MSMNLAFYQGQAEPYYKAIARSMGMGAPINPDFSRLNSLRTLHVPMVRGMNGLGAVRNLALGKTARQSSTFTDSRFGYVGSAGLAVDGNRNGDLYQAYSLSHTNLQSNPWPWWEVDLGGTYAISRIDIYNRTDREPALNYGDRLQNFLIFISEGPFISNDPNIVAQQPGVSAFFFSGTAGPVVAMAVERIGRFVRIQLTRGRVDPAAPEYLALAEVEVYGDDIAAPPPPPPPPTDTTPPPPTGGGTTTGGVTTGGTVIPGTGGTTTPTAPLPPLTIPAPIAQLPLIGPVAQQGAGLLNQTFNLFGYSIPYYAPLIGIGGYYFLFKRRRR